jgi:hypothetical protein
MQRLANQQLALGPAVLAASLLAVARATRQGLRALLLNEGDATSTEFLHADSGAHRLRGIPEEIEMSTGAPSVVATGDETASSAPASGARDDGDRSASAGAESPTGGGGVDDSDDVVARGSAPRTMFRMISRRRGYSTDIGDTPQVERTLSDANVTTGGGGGVRGGAAKGRQSMDEMVAELRSVCEEVSHLPVLHCASPVSHIS